MSKAESLCSHITVYVVLFFILLIAYSSSLLNHFLIDDFHVLFGQEGVIHKSFTDLFTDTQAGFYRPVGHIVLWCFSRMFLQNHVLYHAGNLILFWFITVLFYHMILRLSHHRQLSILACLLYALHPINAMFVNYITASIISSYVIFLQLSFLWFVDSIEKRKIRFYIASLIFFVCSLLSHEFAIIYPLYTLCFLLFIKRYHISRAFIDSLPIFIVTGLFCTLRAICSDFSLSEKILSLPFLPQYFATSAHLMGWYIGKLSFPYNILFLWTEDVATKNTVFMCAIFLMVLASLAYLTFVRWRGGIKAFSLGIFLAGLLPASMAMFIYFPSIEPIIEPHWFYFSSIGIFILLAHALITLKKKVKITLWLSIVLFILSSYFILLSEYNSRWRNPEIFCRYWLSLNQKNLTPFYNLGKYYLDRGDYQKAFEVFQKGIDQTQSAHALIYADMGLTEFRLGNDAAAMEYWRRALLQFSKDSTVYFYLGQYYLSKNNHREAYRLFKYAALLYPENSDYQLYLNIARQKLMQLDDSTTY